MAEPEMIQSPNAVAIEV